MLTSTPPPGFFGRKDEFFAADRQLGYVVGPNYEGKGTFGNEPVTVFTDETGARREARHAPAAQTADLVVVGGEQAFGLGVNYEKTFAGRLAARMGWSVQNYGIPVQSGAAALLMIERTLRLRPKVIVYSFFAA